MMGGCKDGWMKGWIGEMDDGWMQGWMDGWINK